MIPTFAVMPLAILIALVMSINPFPLIAGFWNLLSATRGIRVDADIRGTLVVVHII